jgi:hypothetical protein
MPECLTARAGLNEVTLIWVRGHRGILGDEEADRLAQQASAIPGPEQALGIPKCSAREGIRTWTENQHHNTVPSFFWDVTMRSSVVAYRRFGIAYLPYLSRVNCVEECFITAWPLKVGSIGCPETSVTNYKSSSCNIPEKRRPDILSPFLNGKFTCRD